MIPQSLTDTNKYNSAKRIRRLPLWWREAMKDSVFSSRKPEWIQPEFITSHNSILGSQIDHSSSQRGRVRNQGSCSDSCTLGHHNLASDKPWGQQWRWRISLGKWDRRADMISKIHRLQTANLFRNHEIDRTSQSPQAKSKWRDIHSGNFCSTKCGT